MLDAIQSVSGFVKENEAEFVRRVREASEVKQVETAKAYKKQLAKSERRIGELNVLIRKLYEDNVVGKLSDKRFEILSAEYEAEQEQLEQSIAQTQSQLNTFDADGVRADRFIDIVRRYTDFAELTTPMINEFVEKIVVHEGNKSSGERTQQVDVYLNFIGKFDVPTQQHELTPEEVAEQERRHRVRMQKREYNRQQYAKRRAQKEAAVSEQ